MQTEADAEVRCWIIEYRYRYCDDSSTNWMTYSGFKHLEKEVSWQLKYLRSKRPGCEFRAVKVITVKYERTIIRTD